MKHETVLVQQEWNVWLLKVTNSSFLGPSKTEKKCRSKLLRLTEFNHAMCCDLCRGKKSKVKTLTPGLLVTAACEPEKHAASSLFLPQLTVLLDFYGKKQYLFARKKEISFVQWISLKFRGRVQFAFLRFYLPRNFF